MTNKYTIIGLDCPNCAKKLSSMLGKLDGVKEVKINFLSEELTIESNVEAAVLDAAVVKTAHAFDKHLTVKRK